LAKCQSEIISLEKELSEALQNNLMELSSKSPGNYINLSLFNSSFIKYNLIGNLKISSI